MESTNMSIVKMYNSIPPIHFCTNNPEALSPCRHEETDASFPVSIVARTANRIDDTLQAVNEFTTDMAFQPPKGFYIELIGTNELLKKGYALLQPVVIQPRNTSTIKVLLYKFSDNEDLNTPYPMGLVGVLRCCNYAHIKKQRIEGTDELTTSNQGSTIMANAHSNFSSAYAKANTKNFFE